MRCNYFAAGLSAALLGFSSWASAGAVYNFGNITFNGAQNVASQFSVEVIAPGDPNDVGTALQLVQTGQVGFLFKNTAVIGSSISELYFDDGTLLDQALIVNSTNINNGTSFTGPGANPSNLPGGNTLSPAFVATQGFSADAVGNPSRGVDTAFDFVKIVFNMQDNPSNPGFKYSYGDVINAIQLGLTSPSTVGSLRIGMHVRSIGAQGNSDSFVAVPLPASAWMGLGLLGALGTAAFIKQRQLLTNV
jgi:hypothetical protein